MSLSALSMLGTGVSTIDVGKQAKDFNYSPLEILVHVATYSLQRADLMTSNVRDTRI